MKRILIAAAIALLATTAGAGDMKRKMWVIQIYAAPTDQWIDSGSYTDYGEAHVRMLIAEKTAPDAKWRIVEKTKEQR